MPLHSTSRRTSVRISEEYLNREVKGIRDPVKRNIDEVEMPLGRDAFSYGMRDGRGGCVAYNPTRMAVDVTLCTLYTAQHGDPNAPPHFQKLAIELTVKK